MTTVIDPFKQRTYGVKKPLDAKEEKIQRLLEENKRYYPTKKDGGVDEWGAVIQHQVEQFELAQELMAKQDAVRKRQYQEELKKEMERKQMEKNLTHSFLENEAKYVNERKAVQDHINKVVKQQEVELNKTIIDLNKKQQEEQMKKQQLEVNLFLYQPQYQRELKLEEGRRQRQIVERNEKIAKDLEALKRQTLADSIKQDLEQRQKMKELEKLLQQQEKQEVSQLFKENADRQLMREIEYKQRYIRFNEQERMKAEIFKNSMNSQGSNRTVALSQSLDGASILQRLHNQDQNLQNLRSTAYHQTHDILKRQMIEKDYSKLKERERVNIEHNIVRKVVQDQATKEDLLRQERRKQQLIYKGILDSQINLSKEVTSNYGNMTNVEKKLNRDDLLAFKTYDKNQYAMIPGVRTFSIPKLSQQEQPRDMNGTPQKPQTISLLENAQRNYRRYNLNKSVDNINNMRSILNHGYVDTSPPKYDIVSSKFDSTPPMRYDINQVSTREMMNVASRMQRERSIRMNQRNPIFNN